jgi:hypothetical protein
VTNQLPNSNVDAHSLEDWELRIVGLEERLQPIARRPVDITQPDWLDHLRVGVPPLDEAGVREQMEQLLGELIPAYAKGGDETRSAIRRIFAECGSFAWAAALSTRRTSMEGLRQHLILFSMKDQGQDGRDALLTLQEIVREAATAGVDKAAVLREVAAMSSSTNRYGMGSTRDMLLKFANTPCNGLSLSS